MLVLFAAFALGVSMVSSTGRITPLYNINSTACIAENLRLTDRYICDSQGYIICIGGWSEPLTLCSVPICDLDGKGCINGDCIYPNVCACEVGWDGPSCDECIPLGGCKHGSCSKPMECNCEPGWTGRQCNEPICEDCVNGCCHEPGKCICDFGWTGTNCTECMTLSNCQNGRCLTHPFQCECFEGWKGIDCSTPICRESCHPRNGFCEALGECICVNGWTGADCRDCLPYPGCNGTCVDNKPWTCTDGDGPGNSGEWSPWGQWSACSKSCGDGAQRRERLCHSNEDNCLGSTRQTRDCNEQNCKIDGNWAAWTLWSSCSTSCGTGNKVRHRSCSNPLPKFGGRNCSGDDTENMKCFSAFCPIDGRWSIWSSWGQCSVSCGDGVQVRSRVCDSPSPAHGGNSCIGLRVEDNFCNLRECPIDGNWSIWSQWTSCSKTCGEGQQKRTRSCEAALFGGKPCDGNLTVEIDIIPCWEEIECSIDGNWSSWESWSECSQSCSGGSRTRNRKCDNPSPKFGGSVCRGNPSDTDQCNTDISCPIDGKWNNWAPWSTCSVNCGGGSQQRERACTPPKFGGKDCAGSSSISQECNEISCAIEGEWSHWEEWSPCSKTCAEGQRTRTRNCNAPQNGGAPCFGPDNEAETCNADTPCQDVGMWSQWKQWSLCSVSCGGGEQTRSRVCSSIGCIGSSLNKKSCNDESCETDTTWSEWTQWSSCSAACGGVGQTVRSRVCIKPPPGLDVPGCLGNGIESKTCIAEPCIADPNWSQWTHWSDCSVSCGDGVQKRHRRCDSPAPSENQPFCSGLDNQSQTCKLPECPINGGFSEWGEWSPCTVDCVGDNGDQVRRRYCSKPKPQMGGKPCMGKIKEKRHCTGAIPKQVSDPAGECYHLGT